MSHFSFYFLLQEADPQARSRRGYAIVNPITGAVVSNQDIPDGYMHTVLRLSRRDAEKLAETLTQQTGKVWHVEGAPRPCPKCHRDVSPDDDDFCHPVDMEVTVWRAGCNEHDFGCGYEVKAPTYDEVMAKWNHRDISARAFIRHRAAESQAASGDSSDS